MEMEEVVKEFLVESYENLDQLDRDLVALEEAPGDPARLASIFRTIHTIKGTCGFLSFSKLESVTHVGENLLSRLRDGEIGLTPKVTSVLLALVDAVREMLASIEATGGEGEGEYGKLIEKLTRLQQGREGGAATVAKREPSPKGKKKRKKEGREEVAQATVAAAPQAAQTEESGVEVPASPGEAAAGVSSGAGEAPGQGISDSTIRVDVGLLDKLMNLVGELVLARNQILQFTTTQENSGFVGTSQRLNLITTELQEGVMKTRMQPIGNIWGKLPRVVRDLAVACGKQVRIEMEGKDTELDKTIIESIKDPLTHVVRNAVDHGIEPPEVRVAGGKPAEGRLFLRAFHEGGQVNIEISDDGAGVDPERVKQKAVARGVISADQAARMSDREALNLLFLPGFSTADAVTNVSGRGVGMDVVKTNIEKIGGTVDVQSQLSQGTTLRMKIPLTLAIIPALVVTSAGDRYAIPQVSLLELVRLEGAQARGGIEMIHGAPVYRLRGNLLPVAYLNRELGVDGQAGADSGAVNIVVLQADDRQFGLVVDEINDTEEIVVKPLGKQLKGVSAFAGATIMGDGKVALILDVLGIAQKATVVSEVRERALVDTAAHLQEHSDNRQTLLLVGAGQGGRVAIPLSLVARLEEIPRSAVEKAQNREVVQYRGNILPLMRLGTLLGLGEGVEHDPLQVVVYSSRGRSVGLAVDAILDIVEEQVTVGQDSKRAGIVGSAVVQQRVTDLLDVQTLIEAFDPGFFERSQAPATDGGA